MVARIAESADAPGGSQDTLTDVEVTRQQGIDRGRVVGRYMVLDPIGSGGMSVVYSAFDPELDRRVALKVMRGREQQTDAALERERARITREAQAMARLDHPNVVVVHDVGTVDGRVFLAMQLVDGPTLAQWLVMRPRTWQEIVGVFIGAARGLAAAHREGLVHRDFKPDNVLIDRDDRAKVTDFGLARPGGESDASRERSLPSPSASSSAIGKPVTLAGAILGTPAYMSPEQHTGGTVDARSDQFSFCVALWEALCGERPFAGATVGELAFAVTSQPPRPFVSAHKVPTRIRRALARGLAREPSARHRDMGELIAALEPPVRRRPLVFVAAAVALAGSGFMLSRSGDDDPCEAATHEIDGVWSEPRRDAIDHNLASVAELPTEIRRHSLERLDGHAAQVRERSREACAAHRIRGEESATAYAARMRCLGRRREDLGRVAAMLESDRSDTVRDGIAELDGIVPASACDDINRLLAARPLPDDPIAREQIEALEHDVTALRRSDAVGDDVLQGVVRAVLRSEELAWPASVADSNDLLGTIRERRGEYADAEAAYLVAARAAAEAGEERQLLEIFSHLLFVVGYHEQRLDDAVRIAQIADIEAIRARMPDKRVSLAIALGAAYEAAGRFDDAEREWKAALERTDRESDRRMMVRVVLLNNLGTIALRRGEPAAARARFEEAMALGASVWGDTAPEMADYHLNIALAHQLRGSFSSCLSEVATATAILDRHAAADLARRMRVAVAEARCAIGIGDFARARTTASSAGELLRRVYGDGPLATALANENQALIALYTGDLERARRLADEMEASLVAAGQDRSSALALQGIVAFGMGELAEAERLCTASLAAIEPTVDPRSTVLLEPLACVGAARVGLGRAREGMPLLERAIGIFEESAGDPLAGAHAMFGLAEALVVAGGDRSRARELAVAARDQARLSRRAAGFVDDIESWLERNR